MLDKPQRVHHIQTKKAGKQGPPIYSETLRMALAPKAPGHVPAAVVHHACKGYRARQYYP